MLSNSQQKFLTALQVKKYRQKYRKFLVEGSKLAAELLGQHRVPVDAIYGLESWASEHADLLSPFRSLFVPVTEAELKKISTLTTPNKVLALAGMPPDAAPYAGAFAGEAPAFYLDGIRDPGNLGTILRIADWFGFSAVYCSTDCADVFSPKVVQASMGAVLRVPTAEISLKELLDANPGVPVVGAVLGGENLFETTLPGLGILVIGNEGDGIRPETETLLTRKITIPRSPGSSTESLNAAVAAGILAAFLAKQR